ncbi:MAG: hypothetical protein LC640_04970, partial [Frankia sp.]|nr:hypothetical protein [Frankia sp.]
MTVIVPARVELTPNVSWPWLLVVNCPLHWAVVVAPVVAGAALVQLLPLVVVPCAATTVVAVGELMFGPDPAGGVQKPMVTCCPAGPVCEICTSIGSDPVGAICTVNA